MNVFSKDAINRHIVNPMKALWRQPPGTDEDALLGYVYDDLKTFSEATLKEAFTIVRHSNPKRAYWPKAEEFREAALKFETPKSSGNGKSSFEDTTHRWSAWRQQAEALAMEAVNSAMRDISASNGWRDNGDRSPRNPRQNFVILRADPLWKWAFRVAYASVALDKPCHNLITYQVLNEVHQANKADSRLFHYDLPDSEPGENWHLRWYRPIGTQTMLEINPR